MNKQRAEEIVKEAKEKSLKFNVSWIECFSVSPEEDKYIKEIWEKCPGNWSWMNVFFAILNGKKLPLP